MSDKQKPPYGTSASKPDKKAGVEVGGGDKAAAATDPKAKDEANPAGEEAEKSGDPAEGREGGRR